MFLKTENQLPIFSANKLTYWIGENKIVENVNFSLQPGDALFLHGPNGSGKSTISKEIAPYNITVNAIGPTPIETDLIKTIPKNKIRDLLTKQAIKRFGTFEDIKNVIDFFIDEKSEFITGQTIYLGGIHN